MHTLMVVPCIKHVLYLGRWGRNGEGRNVFLWPQSDGESGIIIFNAAMFEDMELEFRGEDAEVPNPSHRARLKRIIEVDGTPGWGLQFSHALVHVQDMEPGKYFRVTALPRPFECRDT